MDLTERVARCAYCSYESPSSQELPFFEFLGEGSDEATKLCICGYHSIAHDKDAQPATCMEFVAKGDRGYDRFYCGCRGWD